MMDKATDVAPVMDEALVEKLTQSLANSMGQALRVVFATQVNRGVTAGSCTLRARPSGTVDQWEIAQAMRKAYTAHGIDFPLANREEARLFFRLFLEAAKAEVSANRTVSIVDRLLFKATKYVGDDGSYMQPVGASREFNRLPSKVDLIDSPAFVKSLVRKAKRKPFNHDRTAEDVFVDEVKPDMVITCAKCGTVMRVHKKR